MPATQSTYTVSIPVSPPPPSSLSSYARFMHDHTKRQMEASNMSPPPGRSAVRHVAGTVLANGVGPSAYHS